MRATRRRCSPPPTRRCIGKRALDSLFPLGWSHYLAGGLLLGAGISLLFVFTGLIGGVGPGFTTPLVFLSPPPPFPPGTLPPQPRGAVSVSRGAHPPEPRVVFPLARPRH